MKSSYIESLAEDGFVGLKNVLPSEDVEKARQEFVTWFEKELKARREKGATGAAFSDGPFGCTILTKPSHLAVDVMGKCAVFDDLVEQLLGTPQVLEVVKAWSAPNFRIGSVNIRYMTGEIDPPPAHELHRDGPYATNLCIMLSDVEPGDNASTAVIPGSHRSTLNPRWDCLFEKPFRLRKDPARSGLDFFLNYNIFDNLLKRRLWSKVTGAFGKQGDIYFMGNGQVWHGRPQTCMAARQ